MDLLHFLKCFLKVYRNYIENIGNNLEKIEILGVLAKEPTQPREFLKTFGKSMEIFNFYYIIMQLMRILQKIFKIEWIGRFRYHFAIIDL